VPSEPQQRTLTPQVLPDGSASQAAGNLQSKQMSEGVIAL